MFDKGLAFGSGSVLKAEGGEEAAVDEKDGFHAGGGRGKVGEIDFSAAGDGDEEGADVANQALAGLFADIEDGGEGDAFGFGGGDDRTGQRVFRELFEAGGVSEGLTAVDTGGGDDFGEVRTAVGEGAGFIEDEGAAGIDAFEEAGILDDDGAACGERDGTEDGDRNGDEEGAGGGDDEDGEEAAGIAAEEPAEPGDGEG